LRIDLRDVDDTSPLQFASSAEQRGADPDVAAVAPMVTTRNDSVDQDGNAISIYVENGDHTVLSVHYADGRAPQSAAAIALSLLGLNQAGRQVGDTLPVQVGGQDRDLAIVGSYQDITNGGKTAKASLPTDGDDVLWYMVGVQLAPGTDPGAKAAAYSEH